MRIKKHSVQELPRETKSLVDLAKEQGWEHSRTSGGHHRLVSPLGRIVMMSGTPSDYRAVKNFRAQLKRSGLYPRTITVTVKKERQNVTVHEIPQPTIAIMAKPLESAPKTGGGSSDVRGHLLEVLLPLMRRIDKPEGITVNELREPLLAAFPTIVIKSLASTLSYHATRKTLTKVGHGRYRLAELVGAPVAGAPISAPPGMPSVPSTAVSVADMDVEEDIRILDEALAALAKIDQVVRKHREIVKQMAVLKKMWGG